MNTPTHTPPLLSLVVPMYNENEGISLLFSKLAPVLDGITQNWEIVCVNDGSKDDTLTILKKHHMRDGRIKVIGLSRNFGKEAALTAGLHYAKGHAVIPFDADLQDPPELIPEMIQKWQEGAKVVLATRRTRKGDSFLKRITAALFYKTIRKMTRIVIPSNTGDFRLLDRQVVEVIKLLPERTRFMKGMFAWVGFTTAQIFYDRPERSAGTTKFNFVSLMRLAMDGIFSFTTLPLQVWTYAGMLISSASFVYAMYLVVRTLLYGVDVPGYASLMAAVLFMGGIQLISLGIIGEYVGRIYRESKRRPIFVVETTLGIDP